MLNGGKSELKVKINSLDRGSDPLHKDGHCSLEKNEISPRNAVYQLAFDLYWKKTHVGTSSERSSSVVVKLWVPYRLDYFNGTSLK